MPQQDQVWDLQYVMEERLQNRRNQMDRMEKFWKMFLGVGFVILVDLGLLTAFPGVWYVEIPSKLFHSLFWVKAGLAHFELTKFQTHMIPSILPAREFIVYASGVVEIALGVLFLVPAFCNFSGWCLILVLIAVFPANINCVISPTVQKLTGMSQQRALQRLPFQILFLAWTYQFTTRTLSETFGL